MKYPKLIGAIGLVAFLGSGKYEICDVKEADYFASVKYWSKEDQSLRGDFQVNIKLNNTR